MRIRNTTDCSLILPLRGRKVEIGPGEAVEVDDSLRFDTMVQRMVRERMLRLELPEPQSRFDREEPL